MKITYAKQATIEDLTYVFFDLFIVSSGYEQRAIYFEKFVRGQSSIKVDKKIAFCFKDRKVFNRQTNDEFLNEHKFSLLEIEHNERGKIQSLITNLIIENFHYKQGLNILIDYSCMNKTWQAAIFELFNNLMLDWMTEINIYFSYTRSEFVEPAGPTFIDSANPIMGFSPIQHANSIKSLIVGLGYERDKAIGLINNYDFDYSNTYLFVTKSIDNPFTNSVLSNNSELIQNMDFNNIIHYDIDNLSQLNSLLSSLTMYLINQGHRVSIAPLGPKPFTLLSLLIASKFRELTILGVTDGIKASPVDKIALNGKPPIILRIQFKNNKQHIKESI